MDVTAIILHYWRERTPHIARIVSDLQKGSAKPAKIIIFNNNPKVVLPQLSGAITINSGYNFGCLVRHAIGLLSGTSHCLFIDDDMSVQPDALASFIGYQNANPNTVLGFFGKMLGDNAKQPYTPGKNLRDVSKPTEVDLVLGRVHFCATTKLVNSFVLMNRVPAPWLETATDDLLLSFANRIIDKGKNIILPSKAMELGEKGVGCNFQGRHYPLRDECCRRVLAQYKGFG